MSQRTRTLRSQNRARNSAASGAEYWARTMGTQSMQKYAYMMQTRMALVHNAWGQALTLAETAAELASL